MAEKEERPPTNEEIIELRERTEALVSEIEEDLIDARDLKRILTDDEYISRFFLHCTDIPGDHLKNTEEMIIRALKWRKEKEILDIRSNNLEDSLKSKGSLYLRNRDADGKQLLIFEVKKHIKGVNNMNDMHRMFLYFLERVDREDSDGMVTIVFDCGGCGLKNMDMDFIRYMIDVLKDYYPYVLNYILVLDMPWVLNAAWKIIKAWLPAGAVKKIKFVNKNTVDEFVPYDQKFVHWGGEDDWVYEFVEEQQQNSTQENSETTEKPPSDQVLTNGFASEPNSPLVEKPIQEIFQQTNHVESSEISSTMSSATVSFSADSESYNAEVDINPKDELVFLKGSKGLMAAISITNRTSSLIAFKIKTTSPERYRVRPSLGLSTANGVTKIEVFYQPVNPESDDYSDVLKDKFLINLFKPLTNDWKKEIKDAKPFQHQRLRASVKKSLLKPVVQEKKDVQTSNSNHERDIYLKELKSLERSHQNLRDELKTTLFYARMTLLMTVMLAFMVIFFILPNLIWTNGGCDSTEMNDDTFQNESIKTNHEL